MSGEIVGAAICSHVPTIMLAEEQRRRMGGGRDTTLVAGLQQMSEAIDAIEPSVLAIVDTHWFTLTEHVVAGADHYQGVYTSPELPRAMREYEYSFPGAPGLAAAVHAAGKRSGVPTTNATNTSLPVHYPTLNLVDYLRRDEGILSMGVVQSGGMADYLAFGEVLAQGIEDSGERVMLIGAGALSHAFWPLTEIPDHLGFGPEHIVTDKARDLDHQVIDLWSAGNHAGVIDLYPEFATVSPEGRFAHYLILAGALGGSSWTAKGRPMSDYESSLGTGEIHVWFDLEPEVAT